MPSALKSRAITDGRPPAGMQSSLGAVPDASLDAAPQNPPDAEPDVAPPNPPDAAPPELFYARPPVIASLKRRLGAARVKLAANEIDEQECQRQLADAIEDFWSAAAKGTPVIDPDPDDDSRALVTFLWRDGKANVVLLLGLPPDDTTPDDLAPDATPSDTPDAPPSDAPPSDGSASGDTPDAPPPDDTMSDETPDAPPSDDTTPNNTTPDALPPNNTAPEDATPGDTLLSANAAPSVSAPLFAGFMQHITETDIWYAAWRVPLGWRASYCFLPSSSKKCIPGAGSIPGVRSARGTKGAKDADSMDETAIRRILARAQPDPHNPRQHQHQHQDEDLQDHQNPQHQTHQDEDLQDHQNPQHQDQDENPQHQDQHQDQDENPQDENPQDTQAHDEAALSLVGPVKLVTPAPPDDTEVASHEPSPESGRPTMRQKLREKVYGKERPKKMPNTALTPPKIPRPKPAPRVRTTAVTKTLRSQIRAIRAAFRERACEAAGEGWPDNAYRQQLLIDACDTTVQQCLIDDVVESFWETKGAQTPIIYRDPQSRRHVFVTFLWRDSDARAVLLFVNRITDEKNLKDSLMKRLPHTDIWHITYRMERDWRASYCFIPAYDKKSLADITGVHQVSIRKALDRGIADPRNPVVCKNRADNALSVVELPDAPRQPWLAARPQLTCCGNVTSHRMHDGHSVWVYEPPETVRSADVDNKDVPVLIMFDGDMWMRVERFHETLNNLIADGEIPPLYALLVETDNIAARWGELSEDSGVENFVADELLPWACRRWPITDNPARIIVAGQSLGALTALWTAAKRPDCVKNVIAQSASLWRGSLMERLSDDDSPLHGFDGRIYFECGKQEWVLLPLNRRLARLLKAQGANHRYVEYNGGHDYACWRGGIADGLRWITKGWTK